MIMKIGMESNAIEEPEAIANPLIIGVPIMRWA